MDNKLCRDRNIEMKYSTSQMKNAVKSYNNRFAKTEEIISSTYSV